MVRSLAQFVSREATNSGCKPITTTVPDDPLTFPPLPPNVSKATMFVGVTVTDAEGPGRAVNVSVPSTEGLCNAWPDGAVTVATGGAAPENCTEAVATEVLVVETVQLVKGLPGIFSAKVRFVTPTLEKKFTGMLALWPTCKTVEPRLTWTQFPTVRTNAMELLKAGWLLSATQTMIALVVPPCSHEGVHENIPLVVISAPSGAELSKVNVYGGSLPSPDLLEPVFRRP